MRVRTGTKPRIGGIRTVFLHRLKQLFSRIQRADTAAHAAALAYNFLFALFPLLLFLAALLGMMHLPSVKSYFRSPVSALIAPNLRKLILSSISEASRFKSPALLSVGALGFVSAMSGALRQLINALNFAYRVSKPKRKPWKTVLLSVFLGIFLGVLIVLAEAVSTVGGDIIRWLSLAALHHRPSPIVGEAGRWLVFFALMWFILTLIYNWLPDDAGPFRWMTPGTLAAMVLWIVISLGFSLYAANFNHYNQTYGSLGVVILLMLYLYVLAFALLVGGEINALWSTDESQS